MSIVRIGLAEGKKFADGYEAIFGKKKDRKDQKDESGAKAQTGGGAHDPGRHRLSRSCLFLCSPSDCILQIAQFRASIRALVVFP